MYLISVLVICAAVMQFLLLPLYVRMKRRQYNQKIRLFIKGSMTFVAVIVCAAGILRIYSLSGSFASLTLESGYQTNLWVLAAIFICMIADVVLGINFALGMGVFLLGHICYIMYFITIAPFNPASIIIFIVPAGIAFRFFSRYKKEMGGLWPAYYTYGTVILITLSLGLTLPFSIGSYGILPALASAMLVISDYMLALNTILKKKLLHDLIYLGYYFTGQFIMAISVFIPAFLNL